MNDRQKLAFIIRHESKAPEWISELIGWSYRRIHEEYHRAFEEGTYLEIKGKVPDEPQPDVDYDLFVKRLQGLVVLDDEHTMKDWCSRFHVDQYCFTAFYRHRKPNPPSYRYVKKIASALGVDGLWLAGRR